MVLENGFPVVMGIPEVAENLITYCICSDGVYIQKKVAQGFVVVKMEDVPGMAKGVEKIAIMPRKVPLSIFWETLRFFQFVETHFGNVGMEAYVLIGYNNETDEFALYVPKQQVGAASVTYDPNEFYNEYPGYYIVMDIHSHTSKMGAFFSGTDDRDDNRDRYSGVFGKINQTDIFGRPNPEFKIRFSTMGRRTEFKIEDLFCLSDEEHTIDCENVISRVTKPVYTPAVTNQYYGSSNYYGGGQPGRYTPNHSHQGGIKVYSGSVHNNVGVSAENSNGFSCDADDWEKYYEDFYGKDYADPHFVGTEGSQLAGVKKTTKRERKLLKKSIKRTGIQQ